MGGSIRCRSINIVQVTKRGMKRELEEGVLIVVLKRVCIQSRAVMERV